MNEQINSEWWKSLARRIVILIITSLAGAGGFYLGNLDPPTVDKAERPMPV